MTTLQGRNQTRLIDDLTPFDIDQVGALGQARQRIGIHQIPHCVGQWADRYHTVSVQQNLPPINETDHLHRLLMLRAIDRHILSEGHHMQLQALKQHRQ